MWVGYATLFLISIWLLLLIIGAKRLEEKEKEYRRKYGK